LNAFIGIFLIGLGVITGMTWLVRHKYGTILNPYSLFVLYFILHSLLPPIAWHYSGLQPVSDDIYLKAACLTTLHVFALGCCYLTSWSPLSGFLESIHKLFPVAERRVKFARAITIANLVQFGFVFLVLMVASGAGLTWITNSRQAYQYSRAGVGVFWSLAGATLLSGYLFYLSSKRPKGGKFAAMTLLFMFAAFFLGSKALVVSFLLFGIFYYDNIVKRVSDILVVVSGVAGVCIGVGLMLIQGTASNIMQLAMYFDYFNNSAKFLATDASKELQWGAVTLSNLWLFVPRALYPDKPYSYGQNLITDMMCPGQVESAGFTPGLLTWSDFYWDFGIPGIILLALITGMLSKAAFEMFRKKKSYASFIIFGQIGFVYGIHVFMNAPFPLFLVWLLLQWAILGAVSKWMTITSEAGLCDGTEVG